MNHHNMHMSGHVLALFCVLVWGATFISTKVLLVSFSPIEILFTRCVLGFLTLFLLYPHRLRLTDRRQEWYFAAAGLTGVTLYYLLENVALSHGTASNVSVLVSIAPFFTALLARILPHGEKLRRNFIFGFFFAIAGIALVCWGGSQLRISPVGDMLALLAAICWAVYSLVLRKLGTFGYPVIQTTRHTFFYGILFMLPAILLSGFGQDISRFIEPVNLANLLYLSLVASAACFVIWNIAVLRIGPIKSSVYIYLTPIISVIGSAIILQERLTLITLAGTALTLIGLLLSEWRSKSVE